MLKSKAFYLFKTFFKVSCFTLSGGLAMLPALKHELVEKTQYMSEDECVEYIALSQSLPGAIALNFAIACGKKIDGIKGVIAAALGVILPAFLAMLIVGILFKNLVNQEQVRKVVFGVQAGAGAIILASAFQLGKNVLKNKVDIAIMLGAFLITIFGGDVLWVLLGASVVGYIFVKVRGKK